MSGDQHIVGTADGVFITRSIRRTPNPFNLDRLGDLKSWPWEFGHAALGNRLVYSKRVSQPLAFGVGSGMPPSIDMEAIHVHKYAVEHPEEDIEQSAEAGDMREPPPSLPVAASSTTTPMDVSADPHGQKRADDETPVESPKRTRFADKGFSMLESTFLTDDTPVGESAPKTPKRDNSPDNSPDKGHVSRVTSTDLSLYEHEDQAVSFTFKDEELDELETYEMNFK